MDSLKLDRFKRLLNRQNTSINIGEASSTTATNTTAVSSTTFISSSSSSAIIPSKIASDPNAKAINNSVSSSISVNTPNYVTYDNPIPAVFIARKLFSNFIELASNKIEIILNQDSACRERPIFKPLHRGEDFIYDQVLEGLGAISDYCLPSLLSLLLSWYHYQLDVEDGLSSSDANNSLQKHNQSVQPRSATLTNDNQELISLTTTTTEQAELSLPECCGSPSCQTETLITTGLRSSAPPSPDVSLNIVQQHCLQPAELASPLPTDCHSPSPLIITNPLANTTNQSDIFNQSHQQPQPQQQSNNSSLANTSNSAATNASSNSIGLDDSTGGANSIKRLELTTTRSLLIEYAFCQALLEIFGKLNLHPGHENLISQVEDIAFEHFRHLAVSGQQHQHNVDIGDLERLADKYAEVVGILAKTRFNLVKRRFMAELHELQTREPTPFNIQCIVTLLASMRHFRVRMAPIEEFEASFHLLQELADYFVEVRHKSIRHALADLFVEIMLPLATTVKNEVKIPCLRNFVDTLWVPTLEMCARKKHSSTLFPLVTCLLCVSQRAVFLQNWSPFLSMCQSNLKNRDARMSHIALDSLYRLIWMYMIRVKCESNNVTQTRLNSIIDSLFPKGSRQIVPREASLGVFVDIISFIAQERLDFAMRHIIFDLLSVDRSFKVIIAPERMSIGLQAFLVIADSLQQKDGEPASMPLKIGTAQQQQQQQQHLQQQQQQHCDSPRARSHNQNHRMLTEELAKSIGLHPYYNAIQKSFNEILKALDGQFGRPLMLTCYPNTSKDLDELISSDRRPKIDLFRTCIGAIPRIMPDGMSRSELIDLLARMTIHVDEGMRRNAFESLSTLVADFQDWRLDAIEGYTLFLANQIDETLKYLVDCTLKMLLQLLISWRSLITSSSSSSSSSQSASASGAAAQPNSARSSQLQSVISIQTGYETISSRSSGPAGGQIAARKNRALAEMRLIQSELSNTRFDRLVNVIQKVEGASLVMLCSCHNQTRKLAAHLLRECRTILKCYSSWTCMEQFGFRSLDDIGSGGAFGDYGALDGCYGADDLSAASLKGSLSADDLSRITATSAIGPLGAATAPPYSSVTSINTQAMLSTSVSKMCISSSSHSQMICATTATGARSKSTTLQQQQQQQHDLYDEDIENNLTDCYARDENSTFIFWVAVMLLESDKEHEYTFALRLLRKILPNLPFEQQDFVDELDRQLNQMGWANQFAGIHALVLKGCASANNYELCIGLLDHMTPILRQRVCTANKRPEEECLPYHVLVLATYLLLNYDDPSAYCMNIARRIALCCEENSKKFENLSAVMALYSRRSFSKDAFHWIKCIAKYLNDACPQTVPNTIGLLVDLLEQGPANVQRLVLPVVYCILTYIDINAQPQASFNADLQRIHAHCLAGDISAPSQPTSVGLWRDAMQIFKLIISKSSSLAAGVPSAQEASSSASASASLPASALGAPGASLPNGPAPTMLAAGFSLAGAQRSGGGGGLELPGRTMEFGIEIEKLPVIGKARLIELGANLCSLHNQPQSQPQQSVC